MKIFLILILGFSIFSTIVTAGSFTPDPTTPGASAYNLQDIYDKLTDSDYSYSAHSFPPALAPAGTLATLTQIWNSIPAFLTLAEGDLNSGTLLAGIYDDTNLTVIDTDLSAENIKEGETVFGLVGTYVPDSCSSLIVAGLIAYWPFDTDANDASGNDNDGTVNGATLDTENGLVNGAYNFNGTSDYISIGDVDLTDQSINVWVKGDSYADTQQIIFKEGSYYLGVESNQIRCGFWGIDARTGSIELSDGAWHMLTLVHDDGTILKCYVDGVLDVNFPTAVSAGQSDIDLEIGRRSGSGEIEYFDGLIDEAAIWNRTLSIGEISWLYNDGDGISIPN